MWFLAQHSVMTSIHIYHSAWFVNQYILTFASHNQLHMYGFSGVVNLLSSAPDTALQLQCGASEYEPCEMRVMIEELRD